MTVVLAGHVIGLPTDVKMCRSAALFRRKLTAFLFISSYG